MAPSVLNPRAPGAAASVYGSKIFAWGNRPGSAPANGTSLHIVTADLEAGRACSRGLEKVREKLRTKRKNSVKPQKRFSRKSREPRPTTGKRLTITAKTGRGGHRPSPLETKRNGDANTQTPTRELLKTKTENLAFTKPEARGAEECQQTNALSGGVAVAFA